MINNKILLTNKQYSFLFKVQSEYPWRVAKKEIGQILKDGYYWESEKYWLNKYVNTWKTHNVASTK